MLASVSLNNQEVTVYTVPADKKAMVYVYVFLPNSASLTVKINNIVYYSSPSVAFFVEKLMLDVGDSITIGSDGQANVFIHGMEV